MPCSWRSRITGATHHIPQRARTPFAKVRSSGTPTPATIDAATSRAVVPVHRQIACSGSSRAAAHNCSTPSACCSSSATDRTLVSESSFTEIALYGMHASMHLKQPTQRSSVTTANRSFIANASDGHTLTQRVQPTQASSLISTVGFVDSIGYLTPVSRQIRSSMRDSSVESDGSNLSTITTAARAAHKTSSALITSPPPVAVASDKRSTKIVDARPTDSL